MTDRALIICVRTGDPHRRMIPSIDGRCGHCGEPIAISRATLDRPEAKQADTLFCCVECAVSKGYIGSVPILPPTEAQRRELEESGYDPDAWPLRHLWQRAKPS